MNTRESAIRPLRDGEFDGVAGAAGQNVEYNYTPRGGSTSDANHAAMSVWGSLLRQYGF